VSREFRGGRARTGRITEQITNRIYCHAGYTFTFTPTSTSGCRDPEDLRSPEGRNIGLRCNALKCKHAQLSGLLVTSEPSRTFVQKLLDYTLGLQFNPFLCLGLWSDFYAALVFMDVAYAVTTWLDMMTCEACIRACR